MQPKSSHTGKVCIHCHRPVYYSWGYKVWSHEGDRPSKMVVYKAAVAKLLSRYPAADPEKYPLPGTWAKWIACEDLDGNLMGTNATYWPNSNEEGAGI